MIQPTLHNFFSFNKNDYSFDLPLSFAYIQQGACFYSLFSRKMLREHRTHGIQVTTLEPQKSDLQAYHLLPPMQPGGRSTSQFPAIYKPGMYIIYLLEL